MDEYVKISAVSRILDIPASTLRYWESEGLVSFDRDAMSNYRRFDFQSLVEIADIAMARDIDMPLADFEKVKVCDSGSLKVLLDALEDGAEEKIAHFERIIQKIHFRRALIREWERLLSQGIRKEKARLLPVYSFDFESREKVQLYLEDPSGAVDIIPSDGSQNYEYGRFMQESEWGLLRSGDEEDHEYLIGPLWMSRATRETNIAEFCEMAQEMGLTPGKAICQYLFMGNEGMGNEPCYLFKAWLEI